MTANINFKIKIITKNQTDKLMSVLLGIAAFAILLGALFKLEYYPNGSQILYFGFMPSFVLSCIEINRLKERIKILEKETEKTQ